LAHKQSPSTNNPSLTLKLINVGLRDISDSLGIDLREKLLEIDSCQIDVKGQGLRGETSKAGDLA